MFRTVVSGRFWLLPLTIHVSLTWIILYLAAAGLLFFQEYHATTMPVFKRNTRYVLLSFASISTLYLLYASKDPAQIYNMFISEYIRLGISSYISGALPRPGVDHPGSVHGVLCGAGQLQSGALYPAYL